MFNLFLKDGTTVKNNKMRKNRAIVEDDRNKKLLCREVINVLMDYEHELKRIFTLYDYDN